MKIQQIYKNRTEGIQNLLMLKSETNKIEPKN